MAASFQDGSNPYGSFVATFGTLGYVAESASLNTPTNVVEVRNQLGEPSGIIGIPGFVSGSASLQLATTSYPVPTLGAVFTYAFISGTVQTWLVANIGQTYAQQDIIKVNIDFRKRVNS